MLLTEEEAKGKWCPTSFNKAVDNGHGDPDHCCASMCMVWRWSGPYTIVENSGRECLHGKHGCDACSPEFSGMHYEYARTKGYCGLAGKPEEASHGR